MKAPIAPITSPPPSAGYQGHLRADERFYLTLDKPLVVYQRRGGLVVVPFTLDGAPHVVCVRIDPLTGLGHMTLDAGGKDTFLRSVSSTIQSATCCSVEHPDISPNPHLCDSVPAFLRIWMPKDGFPPASSVMWPSPP